MVGQTPGVGIDDSGWLFPFTWSARVELRNLRRLVECTQRSVKKPDQLIGSLFEHDLKPREILEIAPTPESALSPESAQVTLFSTRFGSCPPRRRSHV